MQVHTHATIYTYTRRSEIIYEGEGIVALGARGVEIIAVREIFLLLVSGVEA